MKHTAALRLKVIVANRVTASRATVLPDSFIVPTSVRRHRRPGTVKRLTLQKFVSQGFTPNIRVAQTETLCAPNSEPLAGGQQAGQMFKAIQRANPVSRVVGHALPENPC